MNLLFVEDNIAMQRVVGSLFKSWGFKYDVAFNGREAVQLATCNEGKYDVCFMDTSMPVMNGFEATKAMRQKVRYFPILSTSVDLTYEKELLKIGADDFIAKPYNPKELQRKIVGWCDAKTFLVLHQKDFIEIRKEMPVDKQHAKELKDLALKGLRKIKFFDGPGSTLIVHKNVTNKISHDFIVKKQMMVTFINRDPNMPTRCELYKDSNYLMPQIYLAEDESNNLIEAEDSELKSYPEPVFKRPEDE